MWSFVSCDDEEIIMMMIGSEYSNVVFDILFLVHIYNDHAPKNNMFFKENNE
jgi:hypothetical protein